MCMCVCVCVIKQVNVDTDDTVDTERFGAPMTDEQVNKWLAETNNNSSDVSIISGNLSLCIRVQYVITIIVVRQDPQ